MQMAGRLLFNARAQPLAPLFRARRHVRETAEHRAQIQSRAGGEYWQPFPLPQAVQHGQRQLAISARGRFFLWAENIHQVMRNAAAFGGAEFCGAYIKAAIELRRIARYHSPAEPLREIDTERRLSRCRRANNNNERQKRFVFAHRTRRCRARTKRKMSTKSARRRLPRTCWRLSFTDKRLRSANYTRNKTAARCTVRRRPAEAVRTDSMTEWRTPPRGPAVLFRNR